MGIIRDRRRLRESALARRAAYSLAAGAAASSLAADAKAEVHYFGGAGITIAPGNSQNLNLDGDAFQDIKLKNYIFGGGPYQGLAIPFSPGKFVGFKVGLVYASALAAGDLIDSTTVDPYSSGSLAYGSNNPYAEFQDVEGAYIGFSFPSGSDLHYAWVRVDIDSVAGTFHIDDWAYEDVSNMGILAGDMGPPNIDGDLTGDMAVDGADLIEFQRGLPSIYDADDLQTVKDNFPPTPMASPAVVATPEPGSLGLLAAGSLGLALKRRRRRR